MEKVEEIRKFVADRKRKGLQVPHGAVEALLTLLSEKEKELGQMQEVGRALMYTVEQYKAAGERAESKLSSLRSYRNMTPEQMVQRKFRDEGYNPDIREGEWEEALWQLAVRLQNDSLAWQEQVKMLSETRNPAPPTEGSAPQGTGKEE